MSSILVIVTGAAGAAGSAAAAHLKASGYKVVGLDVADKAPDTLDADHFVGNVDLSDEADTQAAIAKIVEANGPISGVANIAGGFVWETVMDGAVDTWDKMWTLNVKTCLNVCRAAVPHFSEAGGAIVNVSAAATAKADMGMAAYTATKSGVSRLTESLAAELKPRKIRVNAVMPTILDTEANRKDMPNSDFSEWVTTKELSEVLGFLLSPAASAVNGALLPVAGRM